MSIQVSCEHCGGSFSVRDEYAGRRGKCKECGEVLMVPELEEFADPEDPNELVDAEAGEEFDEEGESFVEASVPPTALVAATAGAVVGAVAWAGVLLYADYEIGYVAWGIGGLVGLGATRLGGRGIPMGLLAAALTVFSIFGGKYLGTQLVLDREFEKIKATDYSRSYYNELLTDADDLVALDDRSDESLVDFMLAHGYADESFPDSFDADSVEFFREVQAPQLEELAANEPGFETWREEAFANYRAAFESEFTIVDLIFEDAGGMDIVFLALGIATAFGMCFRAGKEN